MTARAFPAVLLGGDSTVAACPAHETPMSGWGAHLGAPLNMYLGASLAEAGLPPRVVPVLNTAKGGATTASYRAEGLWDALLAASLPGDTVLLQFGHNDQKEPRTLASREGFSDNLSRFIADARGHGLVPILLTSVERRRFDGDRPVPTHGDYPLATRDVALREGIECFDLTSATRQLHAELGPEESRRLFTQFAPGTHPLYPDGIADDTHWWTARR
jgi:lysophospholipase L1-like esterase